MFISTGIDNVHCLLILVSCSSYYLKEMSTELEYIDQSEAYKNFINSIDSDATKKNYHYFFSYFMHFCKIDNYDNMLKIELSRLEGLIRDYIIYLKTDKKLAPGSTSAYLSPISHFYEMNDIV